MMYLVLFSTLAVGFFAAITTATQIAELLPAQGEWEESSYLWLTDRSRRLVEFDNHRIEVLPMPTRSHQLLLKFLLHLFEREDAVRLIEAG